jgi:hypothetical protein
MAPARLYNDGFPDFTPMPDIAPADIADSPLAARRRALAVLCMTDARAKAAAARAACGAAGGGGTYRSG